MNEVNEYSPQSITSIGEAATSSKDARVLHIYEVPESMKVYAGDIVGLVICELTPDEELMASKRTRGDAMRLGYEMARQSLVGVMKPGTDPAKPRMVNVDLGSGSADVLWLRMHPKIRALALTAYNDVHNPNNGEAASFLASRRVQAG